MADQRQQVFDFIQGFCTVKGFSPTLWEIADGCGFNTPQTARNWVNKLINEGVLKKTNFHRGLEVIKEREVPVHVQPTVVCFLCQKAIRGDVMQAQLPEMVVQMCKRCYIETDKLRGA